jgi:AraC family transcriptional regulator
MDWLIKMNSAIDYIENNLTSEIDFNIVAMKACCSSYNSQRMFSFITDIPLAEYIRRRRLTQAALELQNTDTKVINVAVKYGYDSATSFARAFFSLQGLTPTEAKQAGAKLRAYPKISFQISIKGDVGMDYRIETKEGFDVFGIDTVFSLTDAEGFISPAELWQKCNKNGEYDRLGSNAGDLPNFVEKDLCKVHGVENYRKTEENTGSYMLCVFVSKNSKTGGYKTVHIPAQTYVELRSKKFSRDGSGSGKEDYETDDFFTMLNKMQKRFYSEWLPTAKYEKADAANFEIYGGTLQEAYIELWYPIVANRTE